MFPEFNGYTLYPSCPPRLSLVQHRQGNGEASLLHKLSRGLPYPPRGFLDNLRLLHIEPREEARDSVHLPLVRHPLGAFKSFWIYIVSGASCIAPIPHAPMGIPIPTADSIDPPFPFRTRIKKSKASKESGARGENTKACAFLSPSRIVYCISGVSCIACAYCIY